MEFTQQELAIIFQGLLEQESRILPFIEYVIARIEDGDLERIEGIEDLRRCFKDVSVVDNLIIKLAEQVESKADRHSILGDAYTALDNLKRYEEIIEGFVKKNER